MAEEEDGKWDRDGEVNGKIDKDWEANWQNNRGLTTPVNGSEDGMCLISQLDMCPRSLC